MYSKELSNLINTQLDSLKNNGTYKYESVLQSAQASTVVVDGKEVLMMASNNYLGLANNPAIIQRAKEIMDVYGYGMASVRFISGTAKVHVDLEKALAEFLHTEDAILFNSCFAANEAFF